MDFFTYASIAGIFSNIMWVQFLIGGLCFALVFVFQGIALFTIATREGYKNRWMAFVPFFNTYYIGVCAQKNRFGNIDTKKLSLAAAIIEAVLFALFVVYYVGCSVIMMSKEQLVEVPVLFGTTEYRYDVARVDESLKWAAWMYNYMYDYILWVGEILLLIMQVLVLICFFQTYATRRYALFTVTSVLFPIQGILFFVVRNNKGVNYRDFIRAEQARQYRMYQQYQQQQYNNRNPYNSNPYNQPYNNPDGRPQGKTDDPFDNMGGTGSGSGGSDSSPFDEFN